MFLVVRKNKQVAYISDERPVNDKLDIFEYNTTPQEIEQIKGNITFFENNALRFQPLNNRAAIQNLQTQLQTATTDKQKINILTQIINNLI